MTDQPINCTQAGLVTIKEHLERQIVDSERVLRAEIVAAQKALDLAKQELERRMDGFPAAFVQKGDINPEIAELKARIEVNTSWINKMQVVATHDDLKAVRSVAIAAVVISAISTVAAILGLILAYVKSCT